MADQEILEDSVITKRLFQESSLDRSELYDAINNKLLEECYRFRCEGVNLDGKRMTVYDGINSRIEVTEIERLSPIEVTGYKYNVDKHILELSELLGELIN